jgi:hypothetical protein
MSVQQTKTDASDASGTDSMDRRTFLKTVGVGAGGLAVGASGVGPSPVGESEAFLPVVGAVGVGVLAGGALGFMIESEYNVLGSDAPSDSLGPSALADQIAQRARTRKSTNQSTILDNRNLTTYIEEPAFVDGKVAAVEAINSGKTKSQIESAAKTAANAHFATVEKNLLSSWNESVSELKTMQNNGMSANLETIAAGVTDGGAGDYQTITVGTESVSLSDGTQYDVKALGIESRSGTCTPVSRGPEDANIGFMASIKLITDYPSVTYLKYSDWHGVWSDIQTAQQNVVNNLVTWVDTAYSNVSSGDLNPDELLTPTDLVDQYQGENSLAVAHLQALNIPNAGDNEVQIKVSDQYDSTMQGLLAYSEGLSSELS